MMNKTKKIKKTLTTSNKNQSKNSKKLNLKVLKMINKTKKIKKTLTTTNKPKKTKKTKKTKKLKYLKSIITRILKSSF